MRTRLARLGRSPPRVDAPGPRAAGPRGRPAGGRRRGRPRRRARGDVDAAAHVGVFTPGFTTGVDELPGAPRGAGRAGRRGGPGHRGGGLVRLRRAAGRTRWPIPTARCSAGRRPSDGGPRLASFLDGLDAARPGREAHVTAIGHSYGSVVTAAARRAGRRRRRRRRRATSAVPGRRGGAGAPAGARVGGGGRRATRSPTPAWFGPDPNRHARASRGSRRARSCCPTGGCWPSSRGHGAYLTPGTTSAANVAAVVGGRAAGRGPRPGGRRRRTGCGAWWAGEPGRGARRAARPPVRGGTGTGRAVRACCGGRGLVLAARGGLVAR